MAHRIVDETSLKTVADAIREKAGTSDSLVFPTGFAEAIAGIQAGGGSDEEWFNDGDTHIWITLAEGRTSPQLGVCVNGTVTVDWGDGTTPDTLTGTSIYKVKYTQNHNYAKPGNYVITLTADGEMDFKGSSSGGYLLRTGGTVTGDVDIVYRNAIRRIECGRAITNISSNVFNSFLGLSSVVFPKGVTSIGNGAFSGCNSLSSVVIPEGVTSIGEDAFRSCRALANVIIPKSLPSIGEYAFYYCEALRSVVIPEGVTSIEDSAFGNCSSLASVVIPESVTSIGQSAFTSCKALASVIIPKNVTSISAYTFQYNRGVGYYDFSNHTAVPSLDNVNAFGSNAADCEIRVPAALYDEWIAATNWSTYASQIVAV